MAVGDIYQLRSTYNYSGVVEANSVFYYQVTAESGNLSAENVADEFVDNVLPAITNRFPPQWTCNRVFAVNGMDNADFSDTNPQVTGVRTGTALPPFLAVEYRSSWRGPGTRRSYHRFPGGVTADLSANGFWISSMLDELAAAAPTFGQVLEHTEGAVTPCTIVGNFQLGVTPVFNQYAQGVWEYLQLPTSQVGRKRDFLWAAPT